MTSTPLTNPAGSAADWLGPTERSFEKAVRRGDVIEASYRVAAEVVRLRFASEPLHERFRRAFGHLDEPTDDHPSLTINLWDSASTGAAQPPLPDLVFNADAPGAVALYGTSRLRAIYQPNLNALSMFDVDASTAWYWTSDARRLPEWECGTPIRYILNWWLMQNDAQVVHSGAVATRHGGVLIAGRAGSGKSTSSLSTLGAGFAYAGDDYVAVTRNPPHVHSLYNSAKVDPKDAHRFVPMLPSIATAVGERDVGTDKAVVYVHSDRPEQTVLDFPLRALLIPRISSRPESGTAELSRARALAALAPSTIVQLHTSGSEALAMMASLLEEIPCFQLQVGTDLHRIPVAIAELLERLATA